MKNQQKVVILATGGTIAGKGERGKTTGYTPGQITADELIRSVPGLSELMPIEAIQICNENSDDIGATVWLRLAETINRMAKDESVAGFVITHGTDTMEETAYFLNLTVKTDKPVVLTGSMCPSTAILTDGPSNLYQACVLAAHPDSRGRGVMIVFSDRVYSARYMSKTNTSSVTTMSGGMEGSMGAILDGVVYYYYHVDKAHTTATEFDTSPWQSLKKVSIVTFAADADPGILTYALQSADGVVVAGAGMGEYSKAFVDVIANATVPVVVSSRVGTGVVPENSLLNPTAVTAWDLSPQKAAILLRLALTAGKSLPEIREIFAKY